jgi:hypothetical protein
MKQSDSISKRKKMTEFKKDQRWEDLEHHGNVIRIRAIREELPNSLSR